MIDGELSAELAENSATIVLKARAVVERCCDDLENQFTQIEAARGEIEDALSRASPSRLNANWSLLRDAVAIMSCQGKCLAIAHGADGDLTKERTRLEVLTQQFQSRLKARVDQLPESLRPQSRELSDGIKLEMKPLADFILALPLPLIYWQKDDRNDSLGFAASKTPSKPVPSPLVRVIAFLDNQPLATPTLIKPGLLYSLKLRLRGIAWPDAAKSLHLLPITTCPQDEYAISKFQLTKPQVASDGEYTGEIDGQVKFNSPQSSILEDIIFRLRGAFELDSGEFKDVPVIGHDQLRLRVVSAESHPLLAGNRQLDRHIEELVTRMLTEALSTQSELHDLMPMLQALNKLLATYAQEAAYKDRATVPESEFQKTVLRDLRLQLGQEVQEHPGQAGGVTDIRYRGVIVELKVERETGDRKKICQKYTAQPTQYAGVEARQVSIALVLDLTPKLLPPGDIRNDVNLIDVPTHGGDDETKNYPSKAFVFVVNGNVQSPSSYSK